MSHPFKVGGAYRNRHGAYEVVELDGPRMVIQYTDGRQLETTVELQARIWNNIRAEARVRRSRGRRTRPAPKPRSRGSRRGLAFHGLQDHDFKRGIAGTHWRARTHLGGLLAQRMTNKSGHLFQSYAIYRRAEVHIARPDYYNSKLKQQRAKFVLQLDPGGATYGFYIEKNEGPMDDTWDWPRFMNALSRRAKLRGQVEEAARRLGLRWAIYVPPDDGLIAQVRASPTAWIWEPREADHSEEIDWAAFRKRLRGIEAEKWCDLYLCAWMAKEDAIAAGIEIADPVTEVYRALLPLYEISTPERT
jgi:hypothetical protein